MNRGVRVGVLCILVGRAKRKISVMQKRQKHVLPLLLIHPEKNSLPNKTTLGPLLLVGYAINFY